MATPYTIRVWHGRGGRYAGGSRTCKFESEVEPDEFWELFEKFVDRVRREDEVAAEQ